MDASNMQRAIGGAIGGAIGAIGGIPGMIGGAAIGVKLAELLGKKQATEASSQKREPMEVPKGSGNKALEKTWIGSERTKSILVKPSIFNTIKKAFQKLLGTPKKNTTFNEENLLTKRDKAREVRANYIQEKILADPGVQRRRAECDRKMNEIRNNPDLSASDKAQLIGKVGEAKKNEVFKELIRDKEIIENKMMTEAGVTAALLPENEAKVNFNILNQKEGILRHNEFERAVLNHPMSLPNSTDKGMNLAMRKEMGYVQRQLPEFLARKAAEWSKNPPTDVQEAVKDLGADFVKFLYEGERNVRSEAWTHEEIEELISEGDPHLKNDSLMKQFFQKVKSGESWEGELEISEEKVNSNHRKAWEKHFGEGGAFFKESAVASVIAKYIEEYPKQ